MLNFKKFLFESFISKDVLKETIKKFNKQVKLDATGYYLKNGSLVFALAIFELIGKNGDIYVLVDDEGSHLHYVVKFENYYWDINGGSGLKRKEEFITIVGVGDWFYVNPNDSILDIDNKNEILEVYSQLKNIYMNLLNRG